MKINDRRLILIAGLALAIDLSGPFAAQAAGVSKNKPVRVAQVPLDLNSTPVPIAPAPDPLGSAPANPLPAPGWAPTPLGSAPTNPVPAPDPGAAGTSGPSPVVTAPMPLGTKPNLSPADRPPLGFFYGEQDRLEDLKNPNRRRIPWPAVPYQGMVNPPTLLPQNPGGVVLTPVPESAEGPGEVEVPTSQPTGADRFGFVPPPGTLGQTYRRRSRVIEDTKHPRVGAVEVRLPEDVDVTGTGLKVKWTGKVWRLESEPLLPGVPHIYEIKAYWGEGTEPQIRTVRLIMGRIVDLEF